MILKKGIEYLNLPAQVIDAIWNCRFKNNYKKMHDQKLKECPDSLKDSVSVDFFRVTYASRGNFVQKLI